MKYVFIYPAGEQFWKIKQRYTIFQRTLHQHYNLDAIVIDSSSFKGKTIDTGMLCSDADVIIFHIQAAKDAGQVVQHWKARDKVVILDVSVPVVLDEITQSYQLGQSPYSKLSGIPDPTISIDRDRLVWIMKLVDGVIVNSRQMMDDWSGIGKVFIVPDYLDVDQYLIHPFEAHEGIHIGIQIAEGGIKKLRDCGALPAIEVIGKRYPQTNFFINGIESESIGEIRLPVQQKHTIQPGSTNRWMSVLPSLDIGILPKCSAFDRRGGREDILEFMMMKVPWISSAGICCRELGQYGWVVQNNPGTWERILDDMINNLDSYRNETAEGYLYALSQAIDENFEKFLFVCYSIKTDIFSGVV